MSHRIVYDKWTFPADRIREGNLYLAGSLLSSSLEVNTLRATVECADASILDFQRNAKLLYYQRPDRPMVFRVQSILRVGPDLYELASTSTLGLLTEGQHMGGIYTGQEAGAVIAEICGDVPFLVKTNLVGIKLYGWLPIAPPRDNLAQVLFAIGAALKSDLDGVLRIEGLWDGVSGQVPEDAMYTGASADYAAKVTQVIVMEHQYVPWTEVKQLFEGTTQNGDLIAFDEPMHSLTASGFSVLDSGANWARVSAGSGVLSGKTYIHNTRQITKDVFQAQAPNVKTVKDATLVSLVNSSACAQRLVDYYRCLERIDAPVVYRGEAPGDRLDTFHPFDQTVVGACLESADIALSGTLKAQEKSLVGFVPSQIEHVLLYDHVEVLTDAGEWTVPDGITQLRVVCIGGGNGGPSGLRGKPNQPGTSSGASWGPGSESAATTYVNVNSPSKGGAGGAGSAGAQGGKIFSALLAVTPGQKIAVSIGAAGIGGSGSGSTEDTAVQGSAGGATTFGSLSSESGSSSPHGYLEEISGVSYAVPGGTGISGQAGVDGYGESYYDSWDRQTKMEFKYTVPDPLVYNGVSYTAGWAQGSDLASSTTSGTWDENNGESKVSRGRGLGGGAAAGAYGPSSGATQYAGAPGATPVKPPAPSVPGGGGNGGHGGGGAGGNGGNESRRRKKKGVGGSTYAPNISPVSTVVSGGAGGNGGDGAPGCVIIYYGIPQKIESGRFLDKNGRNFLDKLARRVIV